jgi:hypothetical protein
MTHNVRLHAFLRFIQCAIEPNLALILLKCDIARLNTHRVEPVSGFDVVSPAKST